MKMSATLVPKSLQTTAQFDTQIPARDQRAPLLSNNTTVISERDVDLSQSINYNDLVAAIGDPNRILEYSPLKLMASALTDLRTQKKGNEQKAVIQKAVEKIILGIVIFSKFFNAFPYRFEEIYKLLCSLSKNTKNDTTIGALRGINNAQRKKLKKLYDLAKRNEGYALVFKDLIASFYPKKTFILSRKGKVISFKSDFFGKILNRTLDKFLEQSPFYRTQKNLFVLSEKSAAFARDLGLNGRDLYAIFSYADPENKLGIVSEFIDICIERGSQTAQQQKKFFDYGHLDKSFDTLLKAAKQGNEPSMIDVGQIYINQGNFQKGKYWIEKALHSKIIDKETKIHAQLFLACKLTTHNTDLDSAMKHAKIILKNSRKEAYEIIGRIYQLKGDYEHAKKNLEKALLLKNSSSHIFLIQIYFIEEDFENIIRISNCQREFNCFSLTKIGLAYIKLNQEKEAISFFKKALEKGDKKVLALLVELLISNMRQEEAIDILVKGKLNSDPESHYLFLRHFPIPGHEKEERFQYKKLAKQGHLGSAKQVAQYYRDQKDFESAKIYDHIAIKLGDVEAHYHLGIYYKEDIELSKWYFKKAAENGFKKAFIKLAEIFETAGNLKKARKYYKLGRDHENQKRVHEILKTQGEEETSQSSSDESDSSETEFSIKREKYEPRPLTKKEIRLLETAIKKAPSDIQQANKEESRDYQDIEIELFDGVESEIKEFSKKIQTLLSYLANGEYNRGDFEPLHGGLFSMKIDLSNRFIFKIVMGNLNKGIEKICVYSAKGHDPKNLEKTAVKDFEFD